MVFAGESVWCLRVSRCGVCGWVWVVFAGESGWCLRVSLGGVCG